MEKLATYGWSGLSTTTNSDRFATRYSNNRGEIRVRVTDYNGDIIYSVGKVGDATKEVYAAIDASGGSGTPKKNWFKDESSLIWAKNPFMARGSSAFGKDEAGMFSSSTFSDTLMSSYSFRVVLSPSSTNSNS